MREGIHPEYYQATVTCNCGNTFVTGSTKSDIHVEICSKCHSFYTGQQPADVLISSIVNMVSANKIAKSKVEVRSNLNLFLIKPKDVKY